jgi:hypothetical protein
MKAILLAGFAVLMVFAGCATAPKKSNLKLTKSELRALCSKENFALSDSLKQRLLENGEELKLTPEEMQVLKATGKVILCGKCGFILDSLEYKKRKGKPITEPLDKQGFIKGSLRDRMLGPYID